MKAIEPQGFAVMASVGKETGADLKALESVDKYLNSEHGLVLNNPAFTKYYIEYGEISHIRRIQGKRNYLLS